MAMLLKLLLSACVVLACHGLTAVRRGGRALLMQSQPNMGAASQNNFFFPQGGVAPGSMPSGNPMHAAMPFASYAAAGSAPGLGPQYSPALATHHVQTMGERQGQFKEPGMMRSFGQGYPSPDQDHYAGVANPLPNPAGSEGGGSGSSR